MSRETGHSREAELSALNAEKEGLLLRLKQVDEKIRQLENVGDETKQDESEPKQKTPNAEIIKQLGLEWFFKLNLDEIRKSGLPPELEEKFNGQVELIQSYINEASEPGSEYYNNLDGLRDHLALLKTVIEQEILDKKSVTDTLLPGAEWESDGVQRIVKRAEDDSPAIIWRIKKVVDHPYNIQIEVEIAAGIHQSKISYSSPLSNYFDFDGDSRFVRHTIEPAVFIVSEKPFYQLSNLAQSFVRSKELSMHIAGENLVKRGRLYLHAPND
ncbi:MAG: hypothetical protein AAB963_01225 [Patescibacteria group bacterium]